MPAYTDQLLTELVYQDGALVAKVGGANGGGINFTAPLTATLNGSTGNVDIGVTGSPTLGNVTVTSLTYAPGYDVTGPAPARLTTTDATAHTIYTISLAAGAAVKVEFTVIGNLGTANGVANVNAPNALGVWESAVALWRPGSGPVTAAVLSSIATADDPFLPLAPASSTGLVAVVAGATSALIQVNGFAPTEAWTSGHTYTRGDGSTTVGQFVTANGNVYLCTTSGVASGSAPSGTGTGLGTGAKWDYVCAGSTVPVQWTMGAPRLITG